MQFKLFKQLLAKKESFQLFSRRLNKFFLPKDKFIWLVLALALSFFLFTSAFIYLAQTPTIFNSHNQEFIKWLSPDETANYIFTKLYGQTGRLTIFERYNLAAADIIHPRSFLSQAGTLKPVSFLGIIIYYGWLTSLTSYKLIPYFTPALAAIALVYFYLLIKEIFGRRVGLTAVFLLASFPPFVYYSARSMFHNVGFVSFLIIGFYYLVRGFNKPQAKINYLWIFLAGIFIGLSLAFRASEVMWLGPVLLILAVFGWQRLNLVHLTLFLAGVFLAILPVFYWNQILYGAFWRGGYPQMNQSLSKLGTTSLGLAQAAAQPNFSALKLGLRKIKNIIFHFGFRPAQAHLMFKLYGLKMFWPQFYLAIFGLIILFSRGRRLNYKQKMFLASAGLASIFLLYYYGSWQFYDNPDRSQATIGNSYTRYWLPLYLGVVVTAAYGLVSLSRFFPRRLSRPVLVVLTTGIVFLSLRFVLIGSAEGLSLSLSKMRASRSELAQVLALTEPNAVIITLYHDKLFFPERKVIVGLFDDRNMVRLYAKVARFLPLYYYNFTLPAEAIDYLNRRRLGEVGLKIELVKKINSQFSLYKLWREDNDSMDEIRN